MKRKKFETIISATKEKVWKILWNDETYRQWVASFAEGSYADTSWEEGSTARFLGPDGNGMISRIKKNIPFDIMSIEHLGCVMNGVEETTNEEAKKWQGAIENYTVKSTNGKIKLLIETDIPESHLKTFEKAWPKALEKVKELSEK